VQQQGIYMSAYVIFNYTITDHSKIDELTQRSIAVNEQFGAKVIVGSPVKALEGESLPSMVVLEFKDFDAAKQFYHSPEHQALTAFRNKITKGSVSIVPGNSETQAVIDSGYFA
jgi:uncharacterized protein (DUF1330 family)